MPCNVLVPGPVAVPLAPPPARVVTRPVGVIVLIVLFRVSVTYNVPFKSTDTQDGLLKRAVVPCPKVVPLAIQLPRLQQEV